LRREREEPALVTLDEPREGVAVSSPGPPYEQSVRIVHA
jgi:hypothetical protein